MATETKGSQGKSVNQKLKTYLILQCFLKYSDERHPLKMQDILLHLQEDCGIEAERRSVYRDLDDINKILYMLDNDCSIQEAEEFFDKEEKTKEELEEIEDEKFIISAGTNRSGYYLRRRPHNIEVDDIRLLAECVYNARFISESKANELIAVVCGLVSQWDAQEIEHDAFLVDRVKTNNSSVLSNIMIINFCMRRGTAADPHTPEKITFKYQKYSIQDVTKTVDRRKGETYKVSPYKLLINDGNYYLLAFDDRAKDMRTFRVDRMKGVSVTGEPREGEEAFKALDLQNYTQRVFGMFGGERHHITLRFTNDLLDTAIERFGTKAAHYSKADDRHFTVLTEVELSNQFFSWLCGFGNKVKIMEPELAEKYMAHLDKIRSLY